MKTDDLIAMLGTNVEPVDRKYVLRVVGAAVAVGTLVAATAILLAFGLRAARNFISQPLDQIGNRIPGQGTIGEWLRRPQR